MSQSSETAKVNADSNSIGDAVKPDNSSADTAKQQSAKHPASSSGKGLAFFSTALWFRWLGRWSLERATDSSSR